MKFYPLLSKSTIPDAVVLANGEYPIHPLPLYLLEHAPFVVCCDGAADEYISRGHIPDAIVGDGDSISNENHKQFSNILFCDDDQETNDQTKAVNHCIALGKKNILIVGATGKREDHTLGNISLLMDYMDMARVEMATDSGFFTPAKDNGEFASVKGKQVSLINFDAHGLKGENLVYPLRDFDKWWQGTLNEATAGSFIILTQGKYLIFREYTT